MHPRADLILLADQFPKNEFLNLPKNLKPFMKHLCSKEPNTIQKKVLTVSKAAARRTRWAHRLLKENKVDLKKANNKITININK